MKLAIDSPKQTSLALRKLLESTDMKDTDVNNFVSVIENESFSSMKDTLSDDIDTFLRSNHENLYHSSLEDKLEVIQQIMERFKIRNDHLNGTLEQPNSLEEELEQRMKDLKSRKPEDKFSRLSSFPLLSKYTDNFKKGYYIFIGDPNTGKTALMQSMCIDVMSSDSDCDVVYFTLDDTRDVIINRFIASMTQRFVIRNDLPDYAATFMNYVMFKQDNDKRQQVLEACTKVIFNLIKAKRFNVFQANECGSKSAIELKIKEMLKQNKNLVVCVDGALNIEVNARDEYGANNERAKFLMNLSDNYHIPVVTTGELNRSDSSTPLDKIKGSSKFGYNAKFVLHLTFNDREAFDKREDDRVMTKVLKNKLSWERMQIVLNFKDATSYMMEDDFMNDLIRKDINGGK